MLGFETPVPELAMSTVTKGQVRRCDHYDCYFCQGRQGDKPMKEATELSIRMH